MIEVAKLTKRFGTITAVDNVSFQVEPGEVLAFLGPNGAGKSTTIKIIAGFLTPTSGTVRILGKELEQDLRQAKANIGYMPESTPAYKEMTVTEYLGFIAESYGVPKHPSVEATIESTHLRGVESQLVETLSKGYRSRLSFAAAIIHDPPVLLLDEPTDGLDPNQKNEIRTLIHQLGKSKTIVISTHILEEVEAMCNRVAIISEGRLVLNGTTKQLRYPKPTARQLVLSIKPEHKARAEQTLKTTLAPLDSHPETNSYLVEELEPDWVSQQLAQSQIPIEEVFHYRPPLDRTFRELTISRE